MLGNLRHTFLKKNTKGGGGNYANIDSSAMTTGQKGKLESFFIPAQEKHCLTFWYYVDSASGAILKVKTKVRALIFLSRYTFQVSKGNTNNEYFFSIIPILVCANKTMFFSLGFSLLFVCKRVEKLLFSLKACSLDEATLLKLTSSGTGWKQARVDIPVDTHGRQIIFEAERGNSASDVAIDDVSFSNKECPPGNAFYHFRIILI